MTLKDKLLVATKKAADAYNKGMAPSDAVVKAAKAYNFNTDQTERLVEMFNTALTLHNFHKNASDRTGEFDLADKSVVLHGLFEEKPREQVKAAYDYSFYDFPAANLVKAARAELVKIASAENELPEEMTTEDWLRYANQAKEAADLALETENAIQDELTTELSKLAASIKLCYEPVEKYRKVKYASKDCPELLDMLKSILPGSITEDEGAKDFDDDEIVDLSDIEPEKKMSDRMKKLLQDGASIHVMQITFSKKAEAAWDKVMSPHKAPKKDVFDTVVEKAAQMDALKLVSKMIPTTPNMEQAQSVPEIIHEQDMAAQEDLAKISDNIQRQAILQDLLSSDPIISEADPQNVMEMYSTIVNIAPKVSLQKEIVRSMLRQAVNSVALSPFDAKSYVELNNAMNGKVAPQKA